MRAKIDNENRRATEVNRSYLCNELSINEIV